jgi:hypothetical protein
MEMATELTMMKLRGLWAEAISFLYPMPESKKYFYH